MRSVRLEIEVDDALAEASDEWARLNEAWEMIEWVLARDPTVGDPLTEGGQARSFVFEGAHSHDMPNIQVIYVVEREYVTIKSVRFSAPTFSGGRA